MEQSIPEFASGALTLLEVRSKRIHLKDGFHGGTFKLAIEGGGEARRVVNLLGRPDSKTSSADVPNGSDARFAEAGWRGALPASGLVLETPPADTTLPAQSILIDAERARPLLENGIRTGSPRHADLRIERCSPHVAPQSGPPHHGGLSTRVWGRGQGLAARGRGQGPSRRQRPRRLREHERTSMKSELRSGAEVTIAGPLAYMPELRLLIPGGVPGDSTLGELVETVLLHLAGKPVEREQLDDYLAKAARGLAALHGCGARGESYGWEQEIAEVRERIGRLADWITEFEAALAPALARIEELADSHPAQVSLHEGSIAFIDFDGFCKAEPATGLSLFRASMRVEVWETRYLVENLLNPWEKFRPEHRMALLEHHLRQSRLPLL